MKIQRKSQKMKLTLVVTVVCISALIGGVISVGNGLFGTHQVSASNDVSVARITSSHQHNIPYSISINGATEPITITVNRGESAQADVLITPKITGLIGDLKTTSGLPICGSIDAATEKMFGGCSPSGIILSMSENKISLEKHTTLTVNVSKDVPPGKYSYAVVASAKVQPLDQTTPVDAGYAAVFIVEVL